MTESSAPCGGDDEEASVADVKEPVTKGRAKERRPYRKPTVKDGNLFERVALQCPLDTDQFLGCTPLNLS